MFEDVDEIIPAEGEREMRFYYNREARIARAPQIVRDYYADPSSMRPVRGFRIFFTRQNRFIFFALIFFVAFAWIYSALNRSRNQIVIGGTVYELSAFSFEEEVYVTLKTRPKSSGRKKAGLSSPGGQSQGYFTASIFAINSDNQIQEKQALDGIFDDGEQTLRTKIRDFDIVRVDVIVDSQEGSKELSAFVTR
ncbi:MAG: hypothetical protein J1E07_03565 [Treponema sp.]|nr:hypothetical protein [Treponema sp.]